MATYKMIYLNARGRGEVLRLLFAYKGVEFEDVRITDVAKARQGIHDNAVKYYSY